MLVLSIDGSTLYCHALAVSVKLSNYVPALTFVPLNLPYVIETFSKYPLLFVVVRMCWGIS